jgi:hypothetical protein
MTVNKSRIRLLTSCLIYSSIVILIDFVVLFFFSRELNQIPYSLSIVMLVEGALGLVIGGAVAFYSPAVSKLSEVIFHTEPLTAARQKETEKQALVWIAAGSILVFAALLLSAF